MCALPSNVGYGPFDRVRQQEPVEVMGVPYICLGDYSGGELYVTREGWPLLENLRPAVWYNGRQYATRGYRMPGATGAVYRVTTQDIRGRRADLVVKFCRFAQEVPLMIATTQSDGLNESDVANARFNSPFEEFSLLADLRYGTYGPPDLHIRTKRPLAIYCPPKKHKLWQLGRTQTRFVSYERRHERDQHDHEDTAVHLHVDRDYILLFGYIKGDNAEWLTTAGHLKEEEMLALSKRVRGELEAKGFHVLDNKPKHYILRRRDGDGPLLRRDGELVYGLVDYELLYRTPEYVAHLEAQSAGSSDT